MAFRRRSYEETRDSILSQITKGVVNERHVYDPLQTGYKLENTPVREIVKVDGVVGGTTTTFSKGVDYQLSGDMLEWLPDGTKPDDRTIFFVNYTLGESQVVTDVNPGSVVRTIVEAVSREMDFLYAQLNYVYEAGFIETATGSSLDLVVSILGVERKSAEPANGLVMFGRNTDPGDISVEQEAQIQNDRNSYALKNTPVKQIVKIEGNLEETAHEFEQGVDYNLEGHRVEWLAEGKRPDLNSTFYVDYITYELITIPAGTVVSTYTRRTEDAKSFETTDERVLKKTPQPVGKVGPESEGQSGPQFEGRLGPAASPGPPARP